MKEEPIEFDRITEDHIREFNFLVKDLLVNLNQANATQKSKILTKVYRREISRSQINFDIMIQSIFNLFKRSSIKLNFSHIWNEYKKNMILEKMNKNVVKN
jgi:hypothetical protein